LPLVVTVLVTGAKTSTQSSSSAQPAGIAIDPTTHTVYTADSGDDTVSVIQR
jgi:DNA-binding beta-propeller fold protein YncE